MVPPRLINCLARTWLINHQCWNPMLFYFPTLFIFKWFPYSILKLKPHEHQNSSLLIIDFSLKKNYSPNDRFLIKFFVKIISFDSSQRVPTPHEPMCPINNNQRVPLINQPLPRGRLFRGKTRKDPTRSIWPCEGGLINPMLTLIMINDEPRLFTLLHSFSFLDINPLHINPYYPLVI